MGLGVGLRGGAGGVIFGPAGAVVGLLICLSAVGYFGILSLGSELFARLDRLHSNGKLKQAPYRLQRWGKLQFLGLFYVLGLRAEELQSGETRRLVQRAQLFIVLHFLGGILGMAAFFAFVVYPEISRAS